MSESLQSSALDAALQGWSKGEQITSIAKKITEAISGILQLALQLFALSVEIFLHTKFGVRYFTIVWAISSAMAVGLVMSFTSPIYPSRIDVVLGAAYVLGFICLTILHLVDQFRRKGRWHSYSGGVSYGFWRFLPYGKNPWIVNQIHEPLACIVVGVLMVKVFDISIGWVILIGGIAQALEVHQSRMKYREKILDAIDQTIEAEHYAPALQGKKSPRETDGFVVPGATWWGNEEKKTIDDAMAKLDPELQVLMNPKLGTPRSGGAANVNTALPQVDTTSGQNRPGSSSVDGAGSDPQDGQRGQRSPL